MKTKQREYVLSWNISCALSLWIYQLTPREHSLKETDAEIPSVPRWKGIAMGGTGGTY